MAKKKVVKKPEPTNEVIEVADDSIEEAVQVEGEQEDLLDTPAEDEESESVSYAGGFIPLAPQLDASVSREVRIDSSLRGEHGETLKRFRMRLNANSERLNNGRHVESNTDALRFILEKMQVCEGLRI